MLLKKVHTLNLLLLRVLELVMHVDQFIFLPGTASKALQFAPLGTQTSLLCLRVSLRARPPMNHSGCLYPGVTHQRSTQRRYVLTVRFSGKKFVMELCMHVCVCVCDKDCVCVCILCQIPLSCSFVWLILCLSFHFTLFLFFLIMQCTNESDKIPDDTAKFSKDHPLMDEAVKPTGGMPMLIFTSPR